MNATLSQICLNTWKHDNVLNLSAIIWYICGFTCILFGIPAHLFQIILMLNKSNRKDPTSLYFIAIATCELIFLCVLFWVWGVSTSIIKTDPRQIFSCGIFYSILIGPTILSNLYFASMSLDQTFMILYPTLHRMLITRQHVLIRLFLILLIIAILKIPHHFYFYYDSRTTLFICEFHSYVEQWRIRIWSFAHAIAFVSLPSIVTCISSFVLLYNRYTHRKLHKNRISATARRMERNSVVLAFTSIVILISLLPAVILELLIVHDQSVNHENVCPKKWKAFRILFYGFLTLSAFAYSFKFYLRLIMSKACRRDLAKLFYINIQGRKSQDEPCSSRPSNQSKSRNTDPMITQ